MELPICSVCNENEVKVGTGITRKDKLHEYGIRHGSPIDALCIQCKWKIDSLNDWSDSGASATYLLSRLKSRIQSGESPPEFRALMASTLNDKNKVEGSVKRALKALEVETRKMNIITGVLREIETLHADMLWRSYPERRKRANSAISKTDLRLMIFSRDGWKCKRCSIRENLTIDHIIPVSRGGSDEVENLQTLCGPCNSSKGDRTE